MLNPSLPYHLIPVAQATETIALFLKEIRIDRTDAQAKRMCIVFHRLPIIFHIPGDVNGDAGTNPCDIVHLGRVS